MKEIRDMQRALAPTADPGWVLEEEGYDPLHESSVELRFAVSNGFLGVRGARAISRGPMWVRGLHTFSWASGRARMSRGCSTRPTQSARPGPGPCRRLAPRRILLNGRRLLRRSGNTLSHRRILDMRRGALLTEWRQQDPGGVIVQAHTLRLVSLAERAIGLQLLQIVVEQGQADVAIEALFEGAGIGFSQLLEHRRW